MNNADYIKVHTTTFVRHCAKHPAFRVGYESALKDREYDYNIEHKYDAIMYTRGRSFAIYCKHRKQPRAIWRQNILAKTAQERVKWAAISGYLI